MKDCLLLSSRAVCFRLARFRLLSLSFLFLLQGIPLLADQVIINEIMYHPVPAMPEDSGQEWIELYNKGPTAVDVAGWRLTKGVNFAFPNVSIPAGGYLVISANVTTFRAR